jgi:DNA-directed RNA polymerase subunit RPC12/RpoP
MKDSSKLLGFSPNRDLYFNEFREVDIPLNRELQFDTNRELGFDSDRQLPFGKKGVDFRHFICGGCGEVVDGEATRCPNCNSVFKVEDIRIRSDTEVSLSEKIEHSRMNEYFGKEYTDEAHTHPRNEAPVYSCRSCGNDLRYISSRRKWYCDRCRIYIGTAPRGQPRKVRSYQSSQRIGSGGPKFVEDRSQRPSRPSEVVIVEDIDKRKRRRYYD